MQSTEGEDASELVRESAQAYKGERLGGLCTTIPLIVTISNKAEKNPS